MSVDVSATATTQAVLVRPPVPDHAARMREIQLSFIDDPRKAALDADRLLEDLVRTLTADLARRRRELSAATADDAAPATEQLRLAVRRYRELIDLLTQARAQSRFTES
jgi:hypothetical protein